MTNNVIEIVNFKLADHVTECDFAAANIAFQSYIDSQSGVIYRSLAKQKEEKIYVDIVYFETMEDAERIQKEFFENEICQQFATLIDKQSVILEHYNVIAQTPCNA